MYRNAPKHRRTHRDDPDPSEIRDAAGIDPKGTPEFVREVMFAVQRGLKEKETKNLSHLVHYLNRRNILNARGFPWTYSALEAFIRHYKPGLPQLN
jgi:hypothetical protein